MAAIATPYGGVAVAPTTVALDPVVASANMRTQLAATNALTYSDTYWLSLYNLFEIYRLTPGSSFQLQLLAFVAALLYFSTPYFTRISTALIVWFFGKRTFRVIEPSMTNAVILRWYLVVKMALAFALLAVLATFYYYTTYVWNYDFKLFLQSSYYASIAFSLWTLLKLWPVFVTSAATGQAVPAALRWRRWLQLVMVIHASKLQLPALLSQWSLWAIFASLTDALAILFEKRVTMHATVLIPGRVIPGTNMVVAADGELTEAQKQYLRAQRIYSQGVYPIVPGLTSWSVFFEFLCSLYDAYALMTLGALVGWSTIWPLALANTGILLAIIVSYYGYSVVEWLYTHAIRRFTEMRVEDDITMGTVDIMPEDIVQRIDTGLSGVVNANSTMLPPLQVAQAVHVAANPCDDLNPIVAPIPIMVGGVLQVPPCTQVTPEELRVATKQIFSVIRSLPGGMSIPPILMRLADLPNHTIYTPDDAIAVYRAYNQLASFIRTHIGWIKQNMTPAQICAFKTLDADIRTQLTVVMRRFPDINPTLYV